MQTDAYDRARARLATLPARAHFVGVGGVGMAGLALLLARRGWAVTGCDAMDGPLLAWLAREGIAATVGHSPDHATALDPARDLLVRSPAVPLDHPELAAGVARGLTPFDRGVLLAALLDTLPKTVAVCGSHGKTTTSTFAATLLRDLGWEPGWCIGGDSRALGALAAAGRNPDSPCVAECDESDGTLALYHPFVTVVTNIDFDHMEHFEDVAAFEAVFVRVAAQTRGSVVYSRDDARTHALCGELPHTLSFGLHPDARLRASEIALAADGSDFDLTLDGQPLGRWHLGQPGLHNVRNALGALGAVHSLGGELRAAAARMAHGLTLPARRFDVVTCADGIRVVSDYAHHPTEIAALVATACLQPHRRLVAVFQPHRYTRTLALGAQFPTAFAGIDALAIAPVYAASEAPLQGGTTADLYVHFRGAAERDPTIPVPALAPSLAAAWHWLRATAQPGDLVLIVGAGDIVQLARSVGENAHWRMVPLTPPSDPGLRFTAPAPTAPMTAYRVGGSARGLAQVTTVDALRNLVRWCERESLPWTVFGGGTNLLVPDTGYPGVLIQLRGAAFREFALDPQQPTRVTVGAGWPGSALLDRLQGLGLGGLEFMDGIPGTLGGWLAMNAGAHGGAIGDVVESAEILAPDGTQRARTVSELDFDYRHCGGLRGLVALSATLSLRALSPETVRTARADYHTRRTDLAGLRTAGSVFRNPPDCSAGRLLDQAGCKGLRVGGAEISQRHANVIATHPGASASDVLALIDLAARRVAIPLALELRVLDHLTLDT